MEKDEVTEVLFWADEMQSLGLIRLCFFNLHIIQGKVYQSTDGTYYCIVNSCLSIEKQKEVYYHEIKHIYDFIHSDTDEIDHTIMENDADEFADAAKEIAASISFGTA